MRRMTIVSVAMVAVLPGIATAHAFLDHASPRVGSVVDSPPAQVSVRFTQELEPAFSTLRVMDARGKQVDARDKQVDKADAALMRVSVPPLPPGKYRVIWRALSIDTHVTEGDYTFEVKP